MYIVSQQHIQVHYLLVFNCANKTCKNLFKPTSSASPSSLNFSASRHPKCSPAVRPPNSSKRSMQGIPRSSSGKSLRLLQPSKPGTSCRHFVRAQKRSWLLRHRHGLCLESKTKCFGYSLLPKQRPLLIFCVCRT